MEGNAPGKLGSWVSIYLENGWAEIDELMEIQMELLLHFGPVKLDKIIKAAQDLKADYDREDPPEDELEWKRKYILSLTEKNPQNNMVFTCDNLEEKDKYYQMAIEQGYKVKVEEVKND